jgi:hypothetical protein
VKLDPNARCPASGLTNAMCQASICDCFPEEDDRFGIHPEYFVVGGVVRLEPQEGQTEWENDR